MSAYSRDVPSKQFQLPGCDIADAEKANLALAVQRIEGLRHFLRVKQQVRAVQKQHVQVFRLQPLQAFLCAGQDIFPAPVKFLPVKMQAAFALNDDVLATQPRQCKRVPEAGFRVSVPVAGGMVEEIDTLLRRGTDHSRRFRDR